MTSETPSRTYKSLFDAAGAAVAATEAAFEAAALAFEAAEAAVLAAGAGETAAACHGEVAPSVEMGGDILDCLDAVRRR